LRTAVAVVLVAVVLLPAAASTLRAQTVSGVVFDDRDADGIRDVGEPGLGGVQVVLYGTTAADVTVDQTTVTASDGSYAFTPGDGFYLVMPLDPSGWRPVPARSDGVAPSTPGYTAPLGLARYSKIDHAIDHLRNGSLLYAGMGDSIAYNWSSCPNILDPPLAFEYSLLIRDRLREAGAGRAPAATVTLRQDAVKGEHTDDLLIDDGATDHNNAFATIADQPGLISISMVGNDLLDVDQANPTQAQVNLAASEILDSRQNLQEAMSSMLSEIPAADIALNTLYDNEAQSCNTTSFHRAWVPVLGQILRDLAWGQARRVAINEVFAEFAHQDQLSGCTGFTARICNGFLDGIHPNDAGYALVLEKVWQGIGGVTLGPVIQGLDRLDLNPVERHSVTDVDFGYLRRVRRLLPTTAQASGGAAVQNASAALDDQDGGAPAGIAADADGEEVRLAGFPDWFDEVQIVKVVAGTRYRATGSFGPNAYRIEASLTGQFRPPPGHSFSPTDWNYYTPIVGGGGPSQPPGETPSFTTNEVLVVPNPATYREASATLTKNPTLPGGSAEYAWPAVTHDELATTEIRVAATPLATSCSGCTVEVDYAWLDLYGWEKPRPAEVQDLRVGRLADGTLEVSFEPVAGATRYNLYFGRLATTRAGSYDHGAGAPAGPLCAATTTSAGGSRLQITVPVAQQPAVDADILVTAHADDVESPAGQRSDSTEIDRSQSVCD